MKRGKRPSTGLFKELRRENTTDDASPYSLEEFRAEYLAQGESSGYLAASVLLTEVPPSERWQEWRRIFRAPPMSNYLNEWREEMLVGAMAKVEKSVLNGRVDPKDFPRAKWILEGNLAKAAKEKRSRAGRPDKDQPEQQEMRTRRASSLSDASLDNIIRLVSTSNNKSK